MSRFAILLGGSLTVTERLRRQIAGARIIAADQGMVHAAALGVTPELWVGDFDSAGSELTVQYRHVPRNRHPAAKDATDGAIAIDAALGLGAGEIVMVGGMGGQADHMLGHFGQVLELARRGIGGLMTSGDEEAYPLLPGARALDLPAGSRLSIIPFSDLAGLDLAGVRWPLVGRQVPLGSTLTISNIVSGAVEIGLAEGLAVIIAYPAPEA